MRHVVLYSGNVPIEVDKTAHPTNLFKLSSEVIENNREISETPMKIGQTVVGVTVKDLSDKTSHELP